MKLLKHTAAIFCCFVLSGCGEESSVKKAVLNNLKDPDSAKFGDFTLSKNGEIPVACLAVNARNSMGGYTGYQQAALVKSHGEWTVSSISEITHNQCITILTSQ